MTNDEFVTKLGEKYEDLIKSRNDSDYQVNPKNWAKMTKLVDFLVETSEELGGKVMPVELIPKEQHAYIEAVFDILDIYGENVKKFADAIALADVFSVESLINEKIRVGFNINEVFIRKV